MAITNKVIQLNWNIPTKILVADNKRIYARFYIEGDHFFLGGPSVDCYNGIQVSWKNDQDMQAPECQYEYFGVGECKVRVMEVTTSASV